MDTQYPIGRFSLSAQPEPSLISAWLDSIEDLPSSYHAALQNITPEQAGAKYRAGGWTVQQVVHHVWDSHTQALSRFKLALTEDNPTIKPYLEAQWANLADYQLPIAVSLQGLEVVHAHWNAILRSMTLDMFQRTFYHPENDKTYPLWGVLGLYDWHGKHHLAHIHLALGKNI